MPVLGKIVYADGAQPVGVLAVRFGVAGALLLLICRALGQRLPRGRHLAALMALGAVGYVTQSLAYFSALTRIPAGLVALLLYLYPSIVVALGVLLWRERPGRTGIGCLVTALVGTALTIGPVSGGQIAGVVLGILAALAYSGYVVASSRVVPAVGPLAATTVVMCSAGFVYVVLAVSIRPRLPATPGSWAALLAIAVVCTVVASLAFFAGLARLGASDSAVISTLEPVVSVALAALVLGESMTGWQLLGGALVLGAVAVLARLGGRHGAGSGTADEVVPTGR